MTGKGNEGSMTTTEEPWRQWNDLELPTLGSEFEYRGVGYIVLKILGSGGQAISVLVTNQNGEDCVFKIHHSLAGKPADRELKAAKKIKSARCAKVYDVLESDGDVYGLVYEYIEGRTIKEISAKNNNAQTS